MGAQGIAGDLRERPMKPAPADSDTIRVVLVDDHNRVVEVRHAEVAGMC